MSFELPIDLFLSVIEVTSATSVSVESDLPVFSNVHSLVLSVSPETDIMLSNGDKLSSNTINLSFSDKWKTGKDIDKDLNSEDIGFLVYTEDESGIPFIHGSVLLQDHSVIEKLFIQGVKGRLRITIPEIPFNENRDDSYIWGTYRKNLLRIQYMNISTFKIENE